MYPEIPDQDIGIPTSNIVLEGMSYHIKVPILIGRSYFVLPDYKPHGECDAYCVAFDSNSGLATIDSAAEQLLAEAAIAADSSNSFWIGIYRLTTTDPWIWIESGDVGLNADGSTISGKYGNWDSGQP